MNYFGEAKANNSVQICRQRTKVMLTCEELGIVCFGRYTNYFPDSELQLHDHRGAVEICFVDTGKQVYSVEGRDYLLSGGDIFVTYPHETHSTNGNVQERGVLYWFVIEFEKTCCLSLSRENCDLLLDLLRSMPRRSFRVDSECRRLFVESFHLMLRDSPANRLLISANLIRLIYSIAEKSIRLEGSENDRIVRVCSDYVRKHCEQSISVDELADLVSYSPSHFKSVFKKLTGIPPHEFVLREKIKIAAELLRTKSITDVTFLLGFSSSQHFSRVFQSIVGVCPSEYRLQEQVKRRIKRAHNHKA